jgi:hypothetical protein
MRRPLSSKRRRVVRGIVMGAESALCRDPMGERREDGSNVMVAQPDFVHCPMKMRTCTRREKSAETNKCGSATASSPYPTIARCTVPLEVTMRSWLAEDDQTREKQNVSIGTKLPAGWHPGDVRDVRAGSRAAEALRTRTMSGKD